MHLICRLQNGDHFVSDPMCLKFHITNPLCPEVSPYHRPVIYCVSILRGLEALAAPRPALSHENGNESNYLLQNTKAPFADMD